MQSNLQKFKDDLKKLTQLGDQLHMAIQWETAKEEFKAALRQAFNGDEEEMNGYTKSLPSFQGSYERWYTEALSVIKQLIPDRLADFISHYEAPKNRKSLTATTYRIQDSLEGLQARNGFGELVVQPSTAITHVRQQVAILKAAEARFDSSLFDMRQMVQADLLDSEIAAAEELSKHRFYRAAGAVAGVVLEKHLRQVCDNHRLKSPRKHPTISDFNQLLKEAEVIDTPQWRHIQHLGDLRNLCDHGRDPDPSKEQIDDLIAGAKRFTKTLF